MLFLVLNPLSSIHLASDQTAKQISNQTPPSTTFEYRHAYHDNPFSFEFYSKNILKLTFAYTGLIVGAYTGAYFGNTGAGLGGAIVGALSGTIMGSLLGPYLAGDIQGESSSSSIGDIIKGFVVITEFTVLTLGLGISFLPIVSTIYYNSKTESKKITIPSQVEHSLLLSPLQYLTQAGKIVGLAPFHVPHLKIGYEKRLTSNLTLLNQVQFHYGEAKENSINILGQDEDEELAPIYGSWKQKSLRLDIRLRHYLRHALDGLYVGLGASATKSSLRVIRAPSRESSMLNTGSQFIVTPVIELGYALLLSQKFSLNTGVSYDLYTSSLSTLSTPNRNRSHTKLHFQLAWLF